MQFLKLPIEVNRMYLHTASVHIQIQEHHMGLMMMEGGRKEASWVLIQEEEATAAAQKRSSQSEPAPICTQARE